TRSCVSAPLHPPGAGPSSFVTQPGRVGLRRGFGTNAAAELLFLMNQKHELQAIELRERGIDEALKETFPASDPPSFVGAGARKPTEKARTRNRRTKAAEMAGEAIDQQADQSATAEE